MVHVANTYKRPKPRQSLINTFDHNDSSENRLISITDKRCQMPTANLHHILDSSPQRSTTEKHVNAKNAKLAQKTPDEHRQNHILTYTYFVRSDG